MIKSRRLVYVARIGFPLTTIMACSQAEDEGSTHQMWRVAVDVLRNVSVAGLQEGLAGDVTSQN